MARELPHLVCTLAGHPDGTASLSFSFDGATLASGGYDCRLKVWDAHAWELMHDLEGNRRGHVAFWPSRERLICGGLYGETKIWDTRTWQSQMMLRHKSPVFCTAFSPDSRLLATGGLDGYIHVWDISQ